MTEFKQGNLSTGDAFWVMWYFIKEHYDLSDGTFDISDILSACEPMDWYKDGIKRPADNGMIDFWNEALDKYKKEGKPDWKELKK